MSDHLIRCTTRDGRFRIIAAETTRLCETARRLHQTDPTATVALARVTTGVALLGGLLKGEQRLALAVEGNGPLHKLHAETDATGHIRCSIKNPVAALPPRDGKFDVAGAVGKAGFLHVIKDLGLKEPYRGMVQLQTSEIGDDLAYYLTTSEQVSSSVALGVSLDREATVERAGGFIAQALPGASDAAISRLENRIGDLPAVSGLLRDGETIDRVIERLFADGELLPSESIPLQFRCRCNREQVAALLKNLEPGELNTLTEDDEEVTVTCEYCRQPYRFPASDLTESTG